MTIDTLIDVLSVAAGQSGYRVSVILVDEPDTWPLSANLVAATATESAILVLKVNDKKSLYNGLFAPDTFGAMAQIPLPYWPDLSLPVDPEAT